MTHGVVVVVVVLVVVVVVLSLLLHSKLLAIVTLSLERCRNVHLSQVICRDFSCISGYLVFRAEEGDNRVEMPNASRA